jgi:hypothetical protein
MTAECSLNTTVIQLRGRASSVPRRFGICLVMLAALTGRRPWLCRLVQHGDTECGIAKARASRPL